MNAATLLKRNIEQLGSCPPIDVAVVALAICRSHGHEWTTTFNASGAQELFERAREEAATFFERFEGGLFSKGEIVEVAAFAEKLVRDTKALVLGARALALAIDEKFGDTYVNRFIARERTTLRADVGFPVRDHDSEFLGPQPDATARLKLFPGGASPTVPVVLSFEHASALADLPSDACVATILPNMAPPHRAAAANLDEIKEHFEVEADVNLEAGKFFWVRPANADQMDRIRKLVEVAEREGARIALMPELCVTDAQQRELIEWFQKDRKRMLFTAGSAHSEDGGRRMNLARTHVHQDLHLVHEKFNPYILNGQLGEDLHETKSELTVYALGDLRTLVVLVCKDLLAHRVADVLAEMRLWLVLVPSLSPKTDDFRTVAGILATTGQTSLLAAIASFGDPKEAVVVAGRPRKAGSSNLPAFRTREELEGPAVVTTRLTKVKDMEPDQGLALVIHRL
ncbi:MAG: hypothetical protein HYS27_22760 [Deltaproteobacteria bacterium]|nr:hypothetical protein [Deltaproteobacteria bacterium]